MARLGFHQEEPGLGPNQDRLMRMKAWRKINCAWRRPGLSPLPYPLAPAYPCTPTPTHCPHHFPLARAAFSAIPPLLSLLHLNPLCAPYRLGSHQFYTILYPRILPTPSRALLFASPPFLLSTLPRSCMFSHCTMLQYSTH